MTFEDLGQQLRAEREKRGVSIDEVALHLKISGRIIRALEEGDNDTLPHAVYVRGFIRSYAAYLGFNGEELSTAMDTINIIDDSPNPPQSVYTPIDEAPLSRKKVVFTLLLALCFVGAGGFWYLQGTDLLTSSLNSARSLTTATPAPPLNSTDSADTTHSAESKAASKNARNTEKAAATTAQNKAVATPPASVVPTVPVVPTIPVVPVVPTIPVVPVVPVVPAPPPAPDITMPAPVATTPSAITGATGTVNSAMTSGTDSTATRSQQPISAHKIIITALAECWIHSNADSTDTRQFSLRKGDTFALTFNKKLLLKLGNAGGVRIRYDGVDLPAAGGDGQVRTLTFPLEQ